ncbi:MAG: hypothetical protein ACLQVD_10140 [Capsulimonadaceae bacterium]
MRTLEKPVNEKLPTVLSPAELAAVNEAEPYEAGLGVTLDEAHELARKRTQAWMKISPESRAA